jgi:hypothetical protein
MAALAYVTKREEMGFPMLPDVERAAWLAAKAESDAKAAAKAAAKASGAKGGGGNAGMSSSGSAADGSRAGANVAPGPKGAAS